MRYKYEYACLQSHLGDNGTWFDAWSFIETSDPLKAVLLAQEKTYNKTLIGKVKKIELYSTPILENNNDTQ